MKRLLLLISFTIVLTSCGNDDNTVVQCSIPDTISISSISISSATINWQDDNISPSYSIEYGLSGFIQGTGIEVSSSTNSQTLNGLSANTVYDVYIKAICSVSNESFYSGVFNFTTDALAIVPQFLNNLSDLNLFIGDLADLNPSPKAFEYQLVTPLFTDYAHKFRLMALPEGEAMVYDGNGFPLFPDGTVLAKTFFYNYNELDLSAGRRIIETRVLIRENNAWTIGNYVWNEEQTEAVLDPTQHNIPISWINGEGEEMSTEYIVPLNSDCTSCHSKAGETAAIGPKLRTMNFEVNGINQLQAFIDSGYLTDAPDVSAIEALANWEDDSFSLEDRARAYFDVNCAHCHSAGGFCEIQSSLRLDFEIPYNDTQIFERRNSIIGRMQDYVEGFSMPFIGTTMVHTEGFDLIQAYIDTLD